MQILEAVSSFIWGPPLILLILLSGLYFTIRLKLIQLRRFPLSLKLMFSDNEEGKGQVSSFAALCTSLAATIGTGSITGVATAIKAGGPGALFWMSTAAFFGMALKYAECLLGVKYRRFFSDGSVLGGPFYYIEKALGRRFRWLCHVFAVLGMCAALFGIGTMVQANSITASAEAFAGSSSPLIGIVSGILISLLAGFVIIGGIKRIGNVSRFVIPFFACLYIFVCVFILILYYKSIGNALLLVFRSAFHPVAAVGGFLGAGVYEAVRYGIARGVFSNEAGLGSEPIAAAAARTDFPPKQGLISMCGTFIDTLLICNLTGLVILVTGSWQSSLNGAKMTCLAFEQGLFFFPFAGKFTVTVGLIFFAFTSIIGWCYYGQCCARYLGGIVLLKCYNVLYILLIFVGSILSVSTVFTVADICNGLMAVPNITGVFFLSHVVKLETDKYFKLKA